MSASTYKKQFSNVDRNVLSLLDFCKGLAMIWIFLFHYQRDWFGWQGVHIFILLSGFGLTYSCLSKNKISWKHWYVRRAEKILPTYWLVALSGFLLMICMVIIKSYDEPLNDFIKSIIRLILDIFLLRNLSYQTIFNYPFVTILPNDPLWFVPLIFGFYVIFPWLYTLIRKYRTAIGCLSILLGAMAIEFIYRAISIYLLDGFPIGYENSLIGNLSVLALNPLERLPDSFTMPFQLQAPFGLFPSRIAEFVLGMLAAVALVENEQNFNNTFVNYRMGITGVFIWLAGYALVFVGLCGWVFGDFVISLGLVLWLVNLAWLCQQILPFLFLKVSKLGSWSYYIFLTHVLILHLLEDIAAKLVTDNILPRSSLLKIAILGFMIIGTWVASWLLMKFDKSKFPQIITQQTIARFLQPERNSRIT